MQVEPHSWREVLRKVIEDTKHKRQLANVLDIDTRTLDRWAMGTSNPRLSNLVQLIDALPHYRSILTKLAIEEFPEMLERIEAPDISVKETIADIPSVFYDRVLQERMHSHTPLIHWEICTLVLRQLVYQLDSDQTGVAAILAECVPPLTLNGEVQCLQEEFTEFSGAWKLVRRKAHYFLGAESLAGTVASTYRPEIYHEKQEQTLFVSLPDEVNSIAAYPILWNGRVAGCLLTLSPHPNYFTRLRTELVGKYSKLLALAFREQDFYTRERIKLHTMPTIPTQLLFLFRFNDRVNTILSTAQRRGETISRSEAERQTLQNLFQAELSDE